MLNKHNKRPVHAHLGRRSVHCAQADADRVWVVVGAGPSGHQLSDCRQAGKWWWPEQRTKGGDKEAVKS